MVVIYITRLQVSFFLAGRCSPVSYRVSSVIAIVAIPPVPYTGNL